MAGRRELPVRLWLAIIAAVGLGAYEVGRYHRSIVDLVEAARLRVRYVLVEPEWRPAEPSHGEAP